MATEIIDISKTLVEVQKSTQCHGTFNALCGIRENNKSLNTLYRDKNHEHLVMAQKSGTNGYYVRFENGIQICWDRLYIGTKAMNGFNVANVYGGMYASITFPAAFVGKPSVVCNVESNGYSNSQATYATSTSFSARHWLNYSNSSVTGICIYYMAIGKWK